jgi:acetyltransferase-like isoleucine patch superfamily enzyme
MVQGIDVRIDETARIKYPDYASFGDHVAVGMCVYCSVKIRTGKWVHIASLSSIIGGVESSLTIGDFAGISTGARIICGSEDFINSLLGIVPIEFRADVFGNNVIGDFAWVGAGAIVLPNIKIATGSVIGAGAVVTKDTEPWMSYVGNPARAHKMRNKDLILENALKLGYEFKTNR